MSVIMIYEGIPGAEEVAKRVAADLGYKCVGRQDLSATLANYGVPRAKLDEITEKEAHWWDQWLHDLRPYRIALQAAMCEMAQAGPMVYHGHVGHELLPGVSHVLKIFLTGSMELRVDLLRSRLAVDEGTIRKQLEHTDRARSRRLMALFGHDWQDPTRYHLMLNLAMGTEAASQVVSTAAKLAAFGETEASRQAFEDLALARKTQATLLRSELYRDLPIDVKAHKGTVTVSGMVSSPVTVEGVVATIKGIPEVSEVTANLVVMPRRHSDIE
ncbi:MAG: cytidylate kinase family protein [Deltaproteobacteria bacterium]|nr:cytidylate kinase family protein [Deltaproteobacteria bacterium]